MWYLQIPDELLNSGIIDAVLIATPHYSHTTIGVAALAAGLHVMVEKPISVHKEDCETLIAAYDACLSLKYYFAVQIPQCASDHYCILSIRPCVFVPPE
eukprot:COSAG02_NODE_15861_length_1135_cov_1.410232_2_plen_99_part_00